MALILLLTTIGSADPNVALVKILSGEVTLNDIVSRTGFLVSDGDKLTLSKGTEVVVRVFGSSAERLFTGPAEFTINSEALRKDGEANLRGEIRVTDSLGNINTSAGLNLRHGQTRPQRNAEPELSIKASGLGELRLFGGDPERVSPQNSYHIEVKALNSTEPLFRQKLTPELVKEGIQIPGLQAGKSYEILVSSSENSQVTSRDLMLRVLTKAESRALSRLRKSLRRKYRRSKDPQHLFDLAECYLALDQPREALETLARLEHLGLGSEYQNVLRKLRLKTMMPVLF